MARIPTEILNAINSTKNAIENAEDEIVEFDENTRGYVGASSIGKCSRQIWYGFRFATKKKLNARLKRIFERGHIEEARIIKDLKKVGIEVYKIIDGLKIEMNGAINEIQEEVVDKTGHGKGHPDGRCLGVIEAPKTEHLLEIKTMNDSRFKAFQKKGLKTSDPFYYDQVQLLMGRMKLKRCLFIVTNKNTEEREYERIYFDKDKFEELEEKEFNIIVSDKPPSEKYHRSNFNCKFCNQFSVCQDDAVPVVTCRSCVHVDLMTEGKWICAFKNDKVLTQKEQVQACSHYKRSF